jgi:acetate kinase
MKILALNTGSSSVKFQLIETGDEQMRANTDRLLAKGMVDRIGEPAGVLSCEVQGAEAVRREGHFTDHEEALSQVLNVLGGLDHIEGVGHRIVHGGDRFRESVLMDDEVVRAIESFNYLAPLHNPHHLTGYRVARRLLPHAAHVAVFDTAFHQTLPPFAYTYALPYELCEKYRLRRYGFHGTSHRYVTQRFAQITGRPLASLKLITAHLGNGCSMCAVDRGRSVDTSMGLTPLEGLVMGTRSGDIDPATVFQLMSWEHLSVEEIDALLNQRSGLLGLSGASKDMRTLLSRSAAGDARATLAVEVFCYRIRHYLGAYSAVLNGADAILFTGGIGENAAAIRARACSALESLGIEIDSAVNESANGREMDISKAEARTRVWVVPTNEELLIARDTFRCITA